MKIRGHVKHRTRTRDKSWSRISWSSVGKHYKSQLPRLREELEKELKNLQTVWEMVCSSTDSNLTLELIFIPSNGIVMESRDIHERVSRQKNEMDAIVRRCVARLDNLAIKRIEHPSSEMIRYHIGVEQMNPFQR